MILILPGVTLVRVYSNVKLEERLYHAWLLKNAQYFIFPDVLRFTILHSILSGIFKLRNVTRICLGLAYYFSF